MSTHVHTHIREQNVHSLQMIQQSFINEACLVNDVYWCCMASNVLLTLNTEHVHGSLKSKCSWTPGPNITFVFPSRSDQTVRHFYKVSKKISVKQPREMALESDLWKQTVSQNQTEKKTSEWSEWVQNGRWRSHFSLVSIHSSDAKIRTGGSWGYETLHVTGETKEKHQ